MDGRNSASNGSSGTAFRAAMLGLLAAGGMVLNLLELPLRTVFPWAKPGLANAATLSALVAYGPVDAMLVFCCRIVGAGLLSGLFLSPGFFLGAAGGACALWTSWTMLRLDGGRGWVGMLGISVTAAMVNGFVQLCLASLLVSSWMVFSMAPLVGLSSVLGGMAVGWASWALNVRLVSSRMTDVAIAG